jgi:hypothetical protein
MPFLPPLQYFLSPQSQLVHALAADTDDDGVEETVLLYRDNDRQDSFIRGLVAEPPTPLTPTPSPSAETIVFPDVYWLGTGSAVELFQASWERIEVEDINRDGKSEVLLEGQWDEETAAIHVFQWDGAGYRTLLSFRARGDLSASGKDGPLEFYSLEDSFPRSSIITVGSARWSKGRYEVLHSTIWETDAPTVADHPEAALVHTYQALADGDAAAARYWWSESLRDQVDANTLDQRLELLPGLLLERVELLQETDTSAIAAVSLRWNDPTSGAMLRSDDEVWELARQAEGWRLVRLNSTPRPAEWHSFTTDDGLTSNRVTDLLLDNVGRLWIACGDQGLTLWDGEYWVEIHQQEDGLASDTVTALHLDALDRFWFATPLGITYYDGIRWTTYTTADGLPSDEVTSLASDAEGNVWAGTVDGLARFDGQGWRALPTPSSLGKAEVTALAIDQNDALWVGLRSAEPDAPLLARARGEDWELFGSRNGLAAQWISSLAFTADGAPAFALADDQGTVGGLGMLKGKEWQISTSFDALTDVSVHDIAVDGSGTMWLATSRGVAYRTDQTWMALTTEHGLASDSVNTVLATPDGDVYMGTDSGLSLYREPVRRQVVGGGH